MTPGQIASFPLAQPAAPNTQAIGKRAANENVICRPSGMPPSCYVIRWITDCRETNHSNNRDQAMNLKRLSFLLCCAALAGCATTPPMSLTKLEQQNLKGVTSTLFI